MIVNLLATILNIYLELIKNPKQTLNQLYVLSWDQEKNLFDA